MNYIKVTKNDIANGEGIGVALWVSGCTCHCYNCHNPQTWDFNSGVPFTEETMQEILIALDRPYISRLTLSGGHPLEPQNAPEILKIVKRVRMVFPNKDIWIYSGYTWEYIMQGELLAGIMKYTDVLVDGEFVEELKDISLPFRGSSNQRIINVQESLKQNKVIICQI